jgi:hypothetical protein
MENKMPLKENQNPSKLYNLPKKKIPLKETQIPSRYLLL